MGAVASFPIPPNTPGRPSRVVVSTGALTEIRDLARAALPGEACGLLVGKRPPPGHLAVVTRHVPAANLLATATNDRFEIDPRVRLRLQRDLRNSGGSEMLLGHWHAHPSNDPVPSAMDRRMAFEPALLWLIVPLERATGRTNRLPRAWWSTGAAQSLVPVELSMSGPPPAEMLRAMGLKEI